MPCGAGSAAGSAGAARAAPRRRTSGAERRMVFMACLSTEFRSSIRRPRRRPWRASVRAWRSSRDFVGELLRRGDADEADALLAGDVLGHPVELGRPHVGGLRGFVGALLEEPVAVLLAVLGLGEE